MSDWIEHNGGTMPASLKGREFECKRRDGKIISKAQANKWVWNQNGWYGDIAAFRFLDEAFVDVTELQCFRAVANVIGEEAAKHELLKVDIVVESNPLPSAFCWSASIQGTNFWRMIQDGRNPLCIKGKDMCIADEYEKSVMNTGVSKKDTTKSDGSTADYYELPEGAKELQQLISHTNMNAQIGEIFRACYRYGRVAHSEMIRDAKKIKFYAEAEIARLEKLER